MSFALNTYESILKMTKEAVSAALAPARARQAKARFDGKLAELEEQKINAETKVAEICSEKDLDIDKLLNSLDDLALVERRITQVTEVKSQLFPEA